MNYNGDFPEDLGLPNPEKLLEAAQFKSQALKRPANYADLSAREQWAIDKELGILDWEGE